MADSEQVLSQDQIDAMLGGKVIEQSSLDEEEPIGPPVNVTPITIEELRAREAAQAAASQPEPTPMPASGPSPVAPASTALEGRVSQLEQQVASLEATLQDINDKLESMMTSMQGTVGFGARQSFVCSSCQVQGNVAARLNCTSCGEENWWGWWPPQHQQ